MKRILVLMVFGCLYVSAVALSNYLAPMQNNFIPKPLRQKQPELPLKTRSCTATTKVGGIKTITQYCKKTGFGNCWSNSTPASDQRSQKCDGGTRRCLPTKRSNKRDYKKFTC